MDRGPRDFDVAVIGGGFFGCSIAHWWAARGSRTVLLERGADLLGRASHTNQARVHHGYHYPRSVLTAGRSAANFPRFVAGHREAVVDAFESCYAVARRLSKVSAVQFRRFFGRLDLPVEQAPARLRRLFDADLVEEVFSCVEYAFDAVKLRDLMRGRLQESGVDVRTGAEVRRVDRGGDRDRVALSLADGGGCTAARAYNCGYAHLNAVPRASGLDTVPLKHEVAEMALVRVPDELAGLAVTVMCGPFFSLFPWPSEGLHTLSHVRYTPHESWRDRADRAPYAYLRDTPRRSNAAYMVRDAARYLPAVARCEHVRSLYEIKTVLPASEADDSRPILLRRHRGLANFHSVLGAKIDNVHDVLDEIAAHADGPPLRSAGQGGTVTEAAEAEGDGGQACPSRPLFP